VSVFTISVDALQIILTNGELEPILNNLAAYNLGDATPHHDIVHACQKAKQHQIKRAPISAPPNWIRLMRS